MSIPNRFDIVKAIDAAHPTLIQRNTRESVTEFLWRVVWALAQTDANFGFLSKSAGENHTDIPGAGMVALDALCYKGEHNSVDIAHSAGDGPGTGGIAWAEDEERRPSNLWVQAVPFPGQGPTPIPEPEPEPPSSDLEERVAALEAWKAEVTPLIVDAQAGAAEALRLAKSAHERLDRLKATGSINVPVVLEGLTKARAKGDVALRVTD